MLKIIKKRVRICLNIIMENYKKNENVSNERNCC